MPATTSNVSVAIDTVYEPGFVDEVYRYGFLGLNVNGSPVFPMRPTNGGTTVNWKVHSSGQTAEVFVEGQVAPEATNQTYVNASISPTYFRVITEWTGHLKDALQGSGAFFDAIASEIDMARADLIDLINTTLMGASYTGIQVCVDSTTTYAGITRGSATYWESYEANASGALELADLEDATEALMGTQYDGRPGVILAAPNQLTNYYRLAGVVGEQNAAYRVNMVGGGTALDLGIPMNTIGFQNVPMVPVPGLTNTIMLLLDTRPGMWELRVHRPFQTDFQGRSGDADVYAHTSAMGLACYRPRRQGKITGITA